MFVDMYRVSNVREFESFMDTVKKTLVNRPQGCRGIRLLSSLETEGAYIIVSYWADRGALVSGAISLHQDIDAAIKNTDLKYRIETYDISYEI